MKGVPQAPVRHPVSVQTTEGVPRTPLHETVATQATQKKFLGLLYISHPVAIMLPTYSIQSSNYSNHTNVGNGCMSIDKRFGLMNIEHRELVGSTAVGWERPASNHRYLWDSIPLQCSLTIFVLLVRGSCEHTYRELLSNPPHESRIAMFSTRPTRKGSNAQLYHNETKNTFHWRKCWSVQGRRNLP